VQLIAQKFANVLKYDPAQPRDAEGQWTRSGSGPTLPKVEGILDAIGRADGGFTYHAVTGDQPKVGFALSLHPDREAIMDDSKATVVALASYAAKNWDLLKETNNYMGGWHNPEDGKVYLDVSTVVDSAAEAERLCREANQIAYFDLVKGQSIKVVGGRHAKAARETSLESHRTIDRSADYRGHHRPLQAVDGEGSHAGGNRAGQADPLTAVLKFDPNQPRDEQGQWSKTTGRTFTSDEGYEWHEQGLVAEWAKKLPHKDAKALGGYAGFGYHDVNDLRRGTYKVPIKDHFVRAATPEEMRRVGWDPERNEWVPSIKVKEGEYKSGYPVDPRDAITPEYIARFGHPMGKNHARDYDPEDPYHRVDDGRIIVNQYYRPVEGGPTMMFSIQKPGPDLEQLQQVQKAADALDDLIANRGYELPEAIVVERGAYLPGISYEDLKAMEDSWPDESKTIWEEKGFTSTMVGEAGGRAKSYPALGKWESITNRFGSASGVLAKHQDEVGSAVRFHITLPKGTKVAAVEPVRRLSHKFPRILDPSPRPADIEEKYWTTPDYTATPTVDDEDLKDKHRRTESELLLGSGGRFRVTKVHHGQKYLVSDPTLKDVPIVEVYLEYIGGGSSQGG